MILAVHPENAPAEHFAGCNPGATANGLTQNPRKVAKLYAETFADPLRAAVDTIAGERDARRTL